MNPLLRRCAAQKGEGSLSVAPSGIPHLGSAESYEGDGSEYFCAGLSSGSSGVSEGVSEGVGFVGALPAV